MKQTFTAVVEPKDGGWFITTDFPELGELYAFAESYEDIDLLARGCICSSTDWNPFDFDIRYEFPDKAPTYYDEVPYTG